MLWIDVIAILGLGTMIALGWNCRGLGSLRSVRVLGELVQRWDPNVVFLMETKIKKKAMEKVMEKIKFVNGLVVPSEGRSGGLAMLWKREVQLEIMGYSRNHIDAIVTEQVSGYRWRITGFYGHPETHKRKESWDVLGCCKEIIKMAWEGCLNQNTAEGVVASLQNVAADLVRWNASVFGYIPKQIQNKRKELNALVLQDRNGVMGKEINRLRSEINDLLDSEEILWHQRSRVQCIGKGIAILSFFTQKPLRGGRRIRLQDYGMRVGIGVRQVRVLQQLLLAILRSCTLLPIQVEFQKLLTPFQPGSLMR